jgi:hypothetical protein
VLLVVLLADVELGVEELGVCETELADEERLDVEL